MPVDIAIFPGARDENLREVGGKGHSLILMSSKRMPVPPGLVLKVQFFRVWLDKLQRLPEWVRFVTATTDSAAVACANLKEKALQLVFTEMQQAALESVLVSLPNVELFAVRSSSPEEDLEGFSFAGAYQTVLGVRKKDLEEAIRRSFASCLDYAIFAYKQKHGLNPYDPKIAVIVQKQLNSDVAGVGFSLNPLTNDFDEAVITANFGLGETVVAGTVTPDTFVVDKERRLIKSHTKGSKEHAVYLKRDGDTEIVNALGETRISLTDRQICQVTDLIGKAEQIYRKPVDIEWAIEADRLYLLQTRPITVYQPIPPDMVTAPGRRRTLYIDATQSVQAIFEPLSVMGTSVLRNILRHMGKKLYGIDTTSINATLVYASSGHLYMNASTALMFAGKEKLVRAFRILDPHTADSLESVSSSDYVSHHYELFLAPLHLIGLIPQMVPRMITAYREPERAYSGLIEQINNYRNRLKELEGIDVSIPVLVRRINEIVEKFLLSHLLPCFLISRIAIEQIKKVASDQHRDLADLLNQSLPHNVTVEMGLDLYDLSRMLPRDLTAERLMEALTNRSLPEPLLTSWARFIAQNGHRGARELDIATPRYDENHSFLVNQLIALLTVDDNASPRVRYEKSIAEREAAFDTIYDDLLKKSGSRAARFKRLYRVLRSLGGLRETPKYCVMLATQTLRVRLIILGQQWAEQGRLNTAEQIFDLTLEDVENGLKNKMLDLRTLVCHHLEQREKYKVATLPTIFDSRGRIIRAPAKPATEKELRGIPISAGVAQGPVKVLKSPDEKPFLPGEVLVARATDPGWTPLFAAAGAVILEVGGVLQHGALVAREYGLPCVSGVDGATERLKDGMHVQVNGTDGIIKLL